MGLIEKPARTLRYLLTAKVIPIEYPVIVWVVPEPSWTEMNAPRWLAHDLQNRLSGAGAAVTLAVPAAVVVVVVLVEVSQENPNPVNNCGVERPRFVRERTPLAEEYPLVLPAILSAIPISTSTPFGGCWVFVVVVPLLLVVVVTDAPGETVVFTVDPAGAFTLSPGLTLPFVTGALTIEGVAAAAGATAGGGGVTVVCAMVAATPKAQKRSV